MNKKTDAYTVLLWQHGIFTDPLDILSSLLSYCDLDRADAERAHTSLATVRDVLSNYSLQTGPNKER